MSNADSLNFSSRVRIEAICDAFEKAWKESGSPPDLPGFLDQCEADERDPLAVELFLMDRHYRKLHGLPADRQDNFH